MESMRETARAYTARSLGLVKQYPISLLVAASVPFIRTAYLDYRGWYDLGQGGVPHNPLGWIMQCIARLRASRDVKSTSCYDVAKSTELDGQSFLERELPVRTGKAPKTGLWVIPHRQLEDTANDDVKRSMEKIINEITDSNFELLEIGSSQLEGGNPALFVSAEVYSPNHAHVPRAPREVFHSHHSEGSSHAILSATDAATVLERGWAERHALSGRALGIPINYLMIYSPRNEAEIDVVRAIVKAAARYCLEGKKIA